MTVHWRNGNVPNTLVHSAKVLETNKGVMDNNGAVIVGWPKFEKFNLASLYLVLFWFQVPLRACSFPMIVFFLVPVNCGVKSFHFILQQESQNELCDFSGLRYDSTFRLTVKVWPALSQWLSLKSPKSSCFLSLLGVVLTPRARNHFQKSYLTPEHHNQKPFVKALHAESLVPCQACPLAVFSLWEGSKWMTWTFNVIPIALTSNEGHRCFTRS